MFVNVNAVSILGEGRKKVLSLNEAENFFLLL
jgi:hypothetical protein